ncbi:MAG: hypothetical protein ABSF21_00055 [Dehalococcoidia bacterium]
MDNTLTIIAVIIAAIGTIGINAMVFSYFLGKRNQIIDDHEKRLMTIEKENSSISDIKLSIARVEADVKAIRESPIFVDGTINTLIGVCQDYKQITDQIRTNTGKIQTLETEMRMHLGDNPKN